MTISKCQNTSIARNKAQVYNPPKKFTFKYLNSRGVARQKKISYVKFVLSYIKKKKNDAHHPGLFM